MNHITSFHAILEMLRARPDAGTLYVTEDEHRRGPRIRQILEEAGQKGVDIRSVPESKLSEMSADQRGIVLALSVESPSVVNLETLCERVSSGGESLVLVLDHIEDPQNLGAILRSADAFGADAVIIPARRASPLTDAAARSSAGASAWVPLIQVSNLRAAVGELKAAGYWVYAADMTGKALGARAVSDKALIILGNEGHGASRILKESADEIISIPMRGHVDSLNVSVSAGILMYEYRRAHSGSEEPR